LLRRTLSEFGTSRSFVDVRCSVAIEGKADVHWAVVSPWSEHNSRFYLASGAVRERIENHALAAESGEIWIKRGSAVRRIVLCGVLAITACSSTPRVERAGVSEYALERTNVGKTLWVTDALRVCQKPQTEGPDCENLARDQKIIVKNVVIGAAPADKNAPIEKYYEISYGDQKSGFSLTSAMQAMTTNRDPQIVASECKKSGLPRVGMTTEQVVATCWGRPNKVDRTEVGGVISDKFVYDSGSVYLRNGVVTSVQTTSTLH
jgi:hypothetical protein